MARLKTHYLTVADCPKKKRKMKHNAVQNVYTEGDVVADIWKRKLTGETLRDISNSYPGTNHADIQRALKGRFSKKKRHLFGLVKKIEAEACTVCGEVHTIDRACELVVTVKTKRDPKPKKQKERYPRYYSWMFEGTPAKDWR